jgi:alpha-glucosidase
MHDVMRFWLDRGVDGFRIDVVQKLAKDPQLRDFVKGEPVPFEDWQPTIHERLRRLRAVVDEYDERMLVGEVYLLDLERIVSYVNSGDELHLAHNFMFLHLPWEAAAFREAIDGFQALATQAAWPAWFLANHDHPRVASRFGPRQARAVLLMLYALRGTPFIYQGEELALPDAEIPPDRVVDVDGRDPERAPIPWRPGPGAGFTSGEPWLPLVSNADELCAERQAGDPRSALSLARRLAELRAGEPVLQHGEQRTLDAGDDILAWERTGDGRRMLALMNFAAEPRPARCERGTVVVSSDPDRAEDEAGELTLEPYEALLLRLP